MINKAQMITKRETLKYLVRTAPIAIPSGKTVGKSFKECTTKSTQPVDKAVSNSLVNKDFSPILGKGISKTLSPSVLIVMISNSFSGYNSFSKAITCLV